MRKLFKKDTSLSYSHAAREDYEFFVESRKNDIEKLINSASNLFYDLETGQPALYVSNSADMKIVLHTVPNEIFSMLESMLTVKDYYAKKRETLVEVTSKSNLNSSFVLFNDKASVLEKFFDIDTNIKCLVSDRVNLPIYFGHYTVLERFAEHSDFKYEILSIEGNK